jgi:hypothetical protein
MYGKITFKTAKELAEFLKEFTGSTAVFNVTKQGNDWIMEFNGGY